MPPNGVLGLGLDRAGKALAGDWGLLKAELSEVGNPGMFWLCEGVLPPRFREPMPDRGSIWRSRTRESVLTGERSGPAGTYLTCTGDMASRLLVLGARPLGMTPGGGWRALFITLLQLATMVRMVSDSSWDTLLEQRDVSVNKQPWALSSTGWSSTRPGPAPASAGPLTQHRTAGRPAW